MGLKLSGGDFGSGLGKLNRDLHPTRPEALPRGGVP